MSNLKRLCETEGVRISMQPGGVPDNDTFGPGAHAYKVTLRYQGRSLTVPFYTGAGWDREPEAADVLSCLVSDTTGYENAADFGDWAREYGYDEDSRKAWALYQTIARQAAKVRRLLGDAFDRFAGAEH